jgi:hypothetical protein
LSKQPGGANNQEEQTIRSHLRDCRFESVQLLACCVSLVILAAAADLVTPKRKEDWTETGLEQQAPRQETRRRRVQGKVRKGKEEQLTLNKALYPYRKGKAKVIDSHDRHILPPGQKLANTIPRSCSQRNGCERREGDLGIVGLSRASDDLGASG